ncbi:MAG: Flp family type IVb pilin [Gemmataceae bacterium]
MRAAISVFLRNDDGPTTVEYGVLLALIVAVCLAAITTLGSNSNKTYTKVGTSAKVSGS